MKNLKDQLAGIAALIAAVVAIGGGFATYGKLTEKISVLGKNAHPFYKWAKENYGKDAIPKWNFHKIVIGKNGKVADTFASITNPSSKRFINLIEKQIKN